MYATESSTKSNLQAAECFPPFLPPSLFLRHPPRPRLRPLFRRLSPSSPASSALRRLRVSGLYCGPNRYFRQKSFKSFSCRRLRAEVDSELFIRCRLRPGRCTRRARRGLRSLFPRPIALCATALQRPSRRGEMRETSSRKLLWLSDGRHGATSFAS